MYVYSNSLLYVFKYTLNFDNSDLNNEFAHTSHVKGMQH